MAENKIEPPKLTALVSGASSGIGASIASLLMDHNYRVIGTSRDVNKLDNLQSKWNDRFYALELDLCNPHSVASVLTRIPDQWKTIDILVNNAGSDIGGRQEFARGELDNWLNTIETNVSGVIRLTHSILPQMLERNKGDILNIGSTSGLEPVPTTTVYSASKHAIDGFSESLRMELENTGIRVMQILPGMVRTDFAANRFADAKKGEAFYDDYGKWLNAEDIARSTLFVLQQPRHMSVSRLVVNPKPLPE